MKQIFVSQRVDTIPSYGERRDALDQRWASFLWKTGAFCLPVPNHPPTIVKLLEKPPDGILLTGGNSPEAYGGDAPQRDETDHLLLSTAEKQKIPLIGICRGMQSICLHFGGELEKVENHIAVRHPVTGAISREVNSYHSLSVTKLPDVLEPLAWTEDGVIEAMRHRQLPVLGIMWHPEREPVFSTEDIQLFYEIWGERDEP